MKSFTRALLPLISGLLILSSAGLLIHLYRMSYLPGPVLSPGLPRAQFSFSVNLPKNDRSTDRTLLMRVVKNGSDFLSVNYWHAGRTVFQLPVLDLHNASSPNNLRLSLWDPGTYTLSFEDAETGEPVQSTSIHIATPLGLYRNDFLLLLALGILGYFSGRLAIGSLAFPVFPRITRLIPFRRLFFSGLLAISAFLVISVELPHSASPIKDNAREGSIESEGRINAPRMPLLGIQTAASEQAGYLVLRHRLDSWLRFGQDLTLFEGPVSLNPKFRSFILPPDDGRYRMTLWTHQSGTLVATHRTLRASPVSPPFPLFLFLGLTLFSGAFFLLGILSQKTFHPQTTAEKVH